MRKKIPLIPTLFVNNCLISDLKVKADLFNAILASKCTPIDNNSNIQIIRSILLMKNFDSIQFNDDDILKAIRNLNTNKAYV